MGFSGRHKLFLYRAISTLSFILIILIALICFSGCNETCQQIQGTYRNVVALKSRLIQDPRATSENCRSLWPNITQTLREQGERLHGITSGNLGRHESWPLIFPPLGQCLRTQHEDIPSHSCFRLNNADQCSPLCVFWIPTASLPIYRSVQAVQSATLSLWQEYERLCFSDSSQNNQMLNKITNEIEPGLAVLSRHYCSQN